MAKNKKQSNVQLLSPENYIRQKARNLSIYECRVNPDWQEIGTAQVLISRIHANGNLTLGVYMVDLLCLGVRDTHYRFNSTRKDYEDLLDLLTGDFDMEKVPYELVHNIIYAANEFAGELGFKPHKDFTLVSQFILEEDTEEIELIEIECGRDGKPVYVRGESDTDAKVMQIINQLQKTVGEGNFDLVLGDKDGDDDFDVMDEFSRMTLNEKRSLFLRLIRKGMDDFTEAEQNRMRLLTDSLLVDICDEDKVNRLMDSWEAESRFSISDEYYTPEFMGIAAGSIITENDMKLFDEIHNLMDNVPSKIPEKLKELRDKWGNIPLICYFELIYLEKENPREYARKCDEYSALYPDYALIYLNRYAYSLIKSADKNKEELIDFKVVFDGRSSITEYEMFDFQSKKLLGIISRENIDELEAMYSAIDHLELNEDYYGYLKTILLIQRIKMLQLYFKAH